VNWTSPDSNTLAFCCPRKYESRHFATSQLRNWSTTCQYISKMNGSKNPYEILGVSPDADEAAIKKAYRQAARIHHPDKQTTDEDRERASAYFPKIADAYSLLQDPVRRYDWRMPNEAKLKISPQNPSSPSKSTKSTATMNYRVPSTSLKHQSTPHVSTSGPKRRSSNQTTPTTTRPSALRRRESSAAPRLRARPILKTPECKQSPPVARKPAGIRKPVRSFSLGGNTIPQRSMTNKQTRPSALRRRESSAAPRLRARPSISTTEPVARKPAGIRKPVRSFSLGGNTIPQRSTTNKHNISPRPQGGRKKRPSTNKKLERKLAARPSLDTKSQHTSRTVKSEQVLKKSKFGIARKLMLGFRKRSVSTENSSSTISMGSANNSISIRQ
jgi:curved DNA-binding protein CbpA